MTCCFYFRQPQWRKNMQSGSRLRCVTVNDHQKPCRLPFKAGATDKAPLLTWRTRCNVQMEVLNLRLILLQVQCLSLNGSFTMKHQKCSAWKRKKKNIYIHTIVICFRCQYAAGSEWKNTENKKWANSQNYLY